MEKREAHHAQHGFSVKSRMICEIWRKPIRREGPVQQVIYAGNSVYRVPVMRGQSAKNLGLQSEDDLECLYVGAGAPRRSLDCQRVRRLELQLPATIGRNRLAREGEVTNSQGGERRGNRVIV